MITAFRILRVLAWGFGLFVVYGPRNEFNRRAKTWSFLAWGTWSCLVMEAAVLLMPLVPSLALILM